MITAEQIRQYRRLLLDRDELLAKIKVIEDYPSDTVKLEHIRSYHTFTVKKEHVLLDTRETLASMEGMLTSEGVDFKDYE